MKRYHLRKKKIKEIKKNLVMDVWIDGTYEVVENDYEIILVNGVPTYFKYEGKYYPTVLLLLERAPEKGYVTVDLGAVRHILNGADVFAAGIVDADSGIEKGDAVYIQDEKYKKPFAVGIAMLNGIEMIQESKGLAVKNIHYYGDKISKILD